MPTRVTCVAGARPNFVKVAPLMAEFRRRPAWAPQLIHTGQHWSPDMSDRFFQDLEIPAPDFHLGVGGGTLNSQMAAMLVELERVLAPDPPRLVVVCGDVTSTLAGALAAVRLGIPVAHVEAGLRSFDRSMPEEINRVLTDHISEYLFTSEPSGQRNLRAEGIPESRIFFVGNVMIDTLLRFREKAKQQSSVLSHLRLEPGQYAVVTLHRPSNVDHPERLEAMMGVLRTLASELPVVFPVHPRTQARLGEMRGQGRLILCPPLGYLDFLRLLCDARLVLTDSGGIQEETTALQVPCLTLRTSTERPITIERGTNRLVGVDPQNILEAAQQLLRNGGVRNPGMPELWDGQASVRICDVLESRLR